MSDRTEIIDVFGEEVDAAIDTPLVVIEGTKGEPGTPGKDGHSPVVTATKSGKTTTISVDGAAIATVEDGADGKPGAAGADGVTPHIGGEGITWNEYGSRIAWYNADFSLKGSVLKYDQLGKSIYFPTKIDDPNAAVAFTTDINVAPPQGAAYFRVSAKGRGANLIVTLDEPIE